MSKSAFRWPTSKNEVASRKYLNCHLDSLFWRNSSFMPTVIARLWPQKWSSTTNDHQQTATNDYHPQTTTNQPPTAAYPTTDRRLPIAGCRHWTVYPLRIFVLTFWKLRQIDTSTIALHPSQPCTYRSSQLAQPQEDKGHEVPRICFPDTKISGGMGRKIK